MFPGTGCGSWYKALERRLDTEYTIGVNYN